jgi:multidrug efflux pump subunit AcrA (membrane-fusion protein)
MIVKYVKNVGDKVKEGETVVVLEAMKMENALPAPANGTVKTVNFSSGDSVKVRVRWLDGDRVLMQTGLSLRPGVPAVLGGPARGNGEVYAVIVVGR